MAHPNLLLCTAISVCLAATALAPPPGTTQQAPTTTTVRAGYYFAADASLQPLAHLDASLYTHLCYSSLAVHPTRRTLQLPADPAQARLLATFSRSLKAKNPALRTLLSVATAGTDAATAGAAAPDPAFAAMAADPASRAAFVDTAVQAARENGFDGIDVAWRFPASAIEMADFGFLVSDFRAAAPPGFLLTTTVYFSNHVFGAGADYPSEALAGSLDWVSVMAFGLHPAGAGPGSASFTAFDAPLYDAASHFSASYGVVSWLDAGVPAGKVVMGLPLYGRSWFLRNKANSGVGAPVVAAGPKQRGTNTTGAMSYAEVQALAATGAGRAPVMTSYDNASVSSYLAVGDVWVAFDGAAVVAEKLGFAARRGLLGYFLWPVNYDDANLTVSRRASEVWEQSRVSSDLRNATGVRQGKAPLELPPALRSTAPASAPVPVPMSASFSWNKLDAHLHFAVLILLLHQQQ
ncbi:class V chitinase-like [Lolium perenne]|uniref:class V chitinase-like n=1 Tax=Lolium perenne TaxID=4522 RepID=UPI0021F68BCB|nr:class V chitinase-like isoform X2 [Lolium perenne]